MKTFNTTINLLTLSLSLLAMSFLSSCTKNEACIDGPEVINIKDEVTFTFCGEAKELRWELYDGEEMISFPAGAESITHTFNTLTDEAYVIAYAEGKKDEKNDEMRLDLSVIGSVFFKVVDADKSGKPAVAGAKISVYSSEACWLDPESGASCLVESATTGSDGIAELSTLALDGSYHVEVTTDELQSNWKSSDDYSHMAFVASLDNYSGSEQILNEFEVDYNTRYLLMSADKWALTGVLNAGGSDIWNSVEACRKDDYIIFNRDLSWELSEGMNVCNPPYTGFGTYTNVKFNTFPPAFDITTTNTSGDWAIADNKLVLIDANSMECAVGSGPTAQTYKFTRQ